MDWITYLGTPLTAISLIISLHIARGQNKQMDTLKIIGNETQNTTEIIADMESDTHKTTKKLEEIGIKTRDTTEVLTEVETKTQEIVIATKNITSALQANATTQENIKIFFPHNDKRDEKYKLFFPGDHNHKTLPLINAGDSYGMYVISGLLGVDLHLRPIARDDATSLNLEELDCNAILLCDVNFALRGLFEYIHYDNLEKMKQNKNNLPCWFATYDTKLKYPESTYGNSFLINIHDTKINLKKILISQSEESCIAAAKLGKNEPFISNTTQEDYGIIARLSKNDHKYIVIAGIHGYGTLIVASFLDDLIRGKKTFDIEKYQNIFFSNKDFISVIHGDFEPNNFLVLSSGIADNYIWVKDDDEEWTRGLMG